MKRTGEETIQHLWEKPIINLGRVEGYISVSLAAEELHYHPETLRRWYRLGQVEGQLVHGRIMLDENSLRLHLLRRKEAEGCKVDRVRRKVNGRRDEAKMRERRKVNGRRDEAKMRERRIIVHKGFTAVATHQGNEYRLLWKPDTYHMTLADLQKLERGDV